MAPHTPASIRRVTIGLLIGMALTLPAWWLGRPRETPPTASPVAIHPGELVYDSAEPSLRLALVYPATWRVETERGRLERYRKIRLLGYRNQANTYTAFIAIRSRPLQAAGGFHEHVGGLLRRYTSRLLTGTVIERQRTMPVGGTPAADLVVSYTIPPLTRHGGPIVEIPVKTRTVFLTRGSYAYELVYSADAREYAQHEPVFTRLLETLRFE